MVKNIFAAAAKLLTAGGQTVSTAQVKKEGQTAEMASLHREFQGHPSRNLTPSKLASIMDREEQGDITAEWELYEDMEEKDGHVMAEMGKRRRAVTGLDFSIVPPKNPTPEEEDNAARLADMLEGLDDFEDILFDITDEIGKGFCCLEFAAWQRNDDGI